MELFTQFKIKEVVVIATFSLQSALLSRMLAFMVIVVTSCRNKKLSVSEIVVKFI